MTAKLIRNESTETSSRYAGLPAIQATAGRRTETRAELVSREYWDITSIPIEFLDVYQIVEGDRIDVLAAQTLGDSRLWYIIADLNRETITDPQKLEAGVSIYIPKLSLVS